MTPKKRNFSSFKTKDALEKLGLKKFIEWEMGFTPLPPSDFFLEHRQRLRKFNLSISEPAKESLIDAICQEAIIRHEHLMVWKAAPLETDDMIGVADYLIAPDQRYLDTPLLCVAEAKNDNFEKGLAQCLVEMKACQWKNAQAGLIIDVFGVLTNGEGWRFYKLAKDGPVWESPPYAISHLEDILGALHYIFSRCEEQLTNVN